MPPAEAPPAPPATLCPAVGLPRSVGQDLRSYGYKRAAAAAPRPYITSLCSCLDSLITWRQKERDRHPGFRLSSLAEPAWALNELGDRDGDTFLCQA